MRPFIFLVPLVLIMTPATGQSPGVPVHVDVDIGGLDHKDCTVAVPSGADGGDVLDAAVASGCLLEWSYKHFDGYGRYVSSVDFVRDDPIVTYWALYLNGGYATVGIDHMSFAAGDTLGLDYTQWVV